MKIKRAVLAALFFLPVCYGSTAVAKDEIKLADEVETPDVLLQESGDKQKQIRYGDEDIKLSPQGRKDNAQITPDPLEKSLTPKLTKEERDKQAKEEQARKEQASEEKLEKNIKKKSAKKTVPTNDEILTPDPLLDMFD